MVATERKEGKTEYDCIPKICDSGDADITKCNLKVLKVLHHKMYPCKV